MILSALQLQSSIILLHNINIPRWDGCRDKVRRNVRNAELQMKSCIIQVKEKRGKKGKLIILLTTKTRLEVTLNCHSGLLSGNSLGCFQLLPVLSRTWKQCLYTHIHTPPPSNPTTHPRHTLASLTSSQMSSCGLHHPPGKYG